MNPHFNYIAGEWIEGPQAVENRNPSNLDDVVGVYTWADAGQTHESIAAARRAFPDWSITTPQTRADALYRIGDEILARKDELGHLMAREEGKTLPEAIGETVRAGQIFRYFAGEALRIYGDRLDSVRPGVDAEVLREPVGVVGLITPWNFPIAIPAWKIAPALAFGNSVVFKPAELVPGSAWALAEIIARAGIPAGVFNLVMGRGPLVGNALLESTEVDAISFTGSVATGHAVTEITSRRPCRVQMEMGGKNPLIILDDADLERAIDCAVNGAFFSTGQRCTASSRLIVTDGIRDRFVEHLLERVKGLKVDDALKPGTDIGPAVDQRQLDKDLFYLDVGRGEGAHLACGGERLSRDTDGYYLSPALFLDTHNDMRINREEIFGPVAAVIPARDYDEALAIANDTEYGLSSGICTQSLTHARHFKRHARAGLVMVNLPTAGVDYHVPFGGTKGSSHGPREQGHHAIHFYTQVKTAYTA